MDDGIREFKYEEADPQTYMPDAPEDVEDCESCGHPECPAHPDHKDYRIAILELQVNQAQKFVKALGRVAGMRYGQAAGIQLGLDATTLLLAEERKMEDE